MKKIILLLSIISSALAWQSCQKESPSESIKATTNIEAEKTTLPPSACLPDVCPNYQIFVDQFFVAQGLQMIWLYNNCPDQILTQIDLLRVPNYTQNFSSCYQNYFQGQCMNCSDNYGPECPNGVALSNGTSNPPVVTNTSNGLRPQGTSFTASNPFIYQIYDPVTGATFQVKGYYNSCGEWVYYFFQ